MDTLVQRAPWAEGPARRRHIDALGDLFREMLRESADAYREELTADYQERFVHATTLIADSMDPNEPSPPAPDLEQVRALMVDLEVTVSMFHRVWPILQQFTAQFHRAYHQMNTVMPWLQTERISAVWDAVGWSLVGEIMDACEVACAQDYGAHSADYDRAAELRAKYDIPPC